VRRQWEDVTLPSKRAAKHGRALSTAAEHGRASRSIAASMAEGKMKIFRFTFMGL
jgi:hypothetical protein